MDAATKKEIEALLREMVETESVFRKNHRGIWKPDADYFAGLLTRFLVETEEPDV